MRPMAWWMVGLRMMRLVRFEKTIEQSLPTDRQEALKQSLRQRHRVRRYGLDFFLGEEFLEGRHGFAAIGDDVDALLDGQRRTLEVEGPAGTHVAVEAMAGDAVEFIDFFAGGRAGLTAALVAGLAACVNERGKQGKNEYFLHV